MRIRIGLAFAAFILIGLNDGAVGVLIPSIGGFYGIDKATVSLLFLFGSAGYILAAFTSGLLVERLGLRFTIVLGIGLFLVGSSVLSLKLAYVVCLGAWLVLAGGYGIIDAGFNAYIAALPGSNTALLNYLHAFYGGGALMGPVIASGFLVLGLPWNSIYMLWVVLNIAVGAGVWLAFQGRQARPDIESAEKAGTGNVMAGALKLRVAWLAAFFLLFYVGSEVSVGNWSYSLLTQERGQAALVAGWTVSGYWMGLTLGRVFLGRLAPRLGDKALIQLCIGGVVMGLLLTWLPLEASAAVGLWLTGFCLGPIFPTTIAVMSRMVPPRLLPSAIGFAASLGAVGGAFLPWTAGNLAQGAGLWTLMPYVIVLTVAMLLFWLALQSQPTAQATTQEAYGD